MIMFKSIAVLDTETTSLPENDHNTTKIIELAVLGCEIDHVINLKKLPRVLHKLVLLFNPLKTIAPTGSLVSGLFNELLVNVKPFTEDDAEILKNFIIRLPPPVCIVAHNGNKFDFPILRTALLKVNKILPENVYCVDSLKAFKEILPRSEKSFCTQQIRASNETTPKGQRTRLVNSLPYKHVARRLFQDDNEMFPLNDEFSEWVSSQDNNQIDLGCPKSYSLRDLYYFFFNNNFSEAHRAEEDAKALLNCIIHCGKFWEWITENAVTFNSIEPLF